MKKEKENNKNKIHNDIIDFRLYISLATAVLLISIGSFIGNFGSDKIPKDVAIWGAFGDYLGGTLNPIFAFASFIALLYTINLQSKELKASREELELTREELTRSADAQKEQSESIKIQNFENTFFNMLNLHNEGIKYMILKELSYTSKSASGGEKKDADYYYIGETLINLTANRDYAGKEAISRLWLIHILYQEKKGWGNYRSNYNEFYEEYRNLLTHYFKTMYQIFLLIESNKERKLEQKYANIFKAQFTTDELKLILLNTLSKQSEGIAKYIEFVEKYAFFDSIILDNDIIRCLPIEQLNNKAFGSNNIIISKLNKKREIPSK